MSDICQICLGRGGWLKPCPSCGQVKKAYAPIGGPASQPDPKVWDQEKIDLRALIERKDAEIERLRKALKPFAAYAEVLREGSVNWLPCPVTADPTCRDRDLTVGDLRNARAALTASEAETPVSEAAAPEAMPRSY